MKKFLLVSATVLALSTAPAAWAAHDGGGHSGSGDGGHGSSGGGESGGNTHGGGSSGSGGHGAPGGDAHGAPPISWHPPTALSGSSSNHGTHGWTRDQGGTPHSGSDFAPRDRTGNAVTGGSNPSFTVNRHGHAGHAGGATHLHLGFDAPHRFRHGGYHRPHGWYYRRWAYGDILPSLFYGSDYWIDDYADFDLDEPPADAEWIRYGDDALLVDRDSGKILEAEYGVFYNDDNGETTAPDQNAPVDVDSLRRDYVAPHQFHGGEYDAPVGWKYHRWTDGEVLPARYFKPHHWIGNAAELDLMDPPDSMVWVRYGNDALLVDQDSGEVIQAVYDLFYADDDGPP